MNIIEKIRKDGQSQFGCSMVDVEKLIKQNEQLKSALKDMTCFALSKLDDYSRSKEMAIFINAENALIEVE